ncbi:MAG: phenylalanine--tRNA ligase subunit beta [Planctomycetia bacterium]|nr:phenylalanine--tRNA ligase subunit beta [Planctomycetia bacterium]
MYISLDWISDFVDLSEITPEEIANRLTMATAEVEGIETVQRAVRGVFVGEVVFAQKFVVARPDGSEKTLTECKVDCGAQGVFHTVCGAPNCALGVKAPFAPAGVTIADGVKILETTLGGKPSQGILCSAKEIGLSRWHEGLFLLPPATQNGTPLETLIPEEDTLLEIDNKSITHRPDLWGHYGFAREFAAIFGRELKPLPQHDLAQYDNLPAIPIQIDDFSACPCYGAISMEMPEIPPAPIKMQSRLHALGQRTFDLMVDVTNYVMWELGQPSHAFDGDKTDKIRIMRFSQILEHKNAFAPEGIFTTLDNQARKMLPDDLLITSDDGDTITPIALAGVMGGLDSEITPTTKRILLECANFHSATIRRTAVRLDLRSHASQRFEKSQPPMNTRVAAGRILQLLEDSGVSFRVTGRYTFDGDEKSGYRPLTLPPGMLERLAGIDLPHEEILAILHSIGFGAEYDADGALQVQIPPFRSEKDISIPEDIVEEVLRVYGYDRIPPQMPSMEICPLKVVKELRLEHKARILLTSAHKFVEVHNYSWLDDHWNATIGFSPVDVIELANPTVSFNRYLRTTLMPNLLALVGKNRGNRDRFRLMEFGSVYTAIDRPLPEMEVVETDQPLPKAAIARGKNWISRCYERTRLAGVSYATAASGSLEDHYREIKGVLEDLAQLLGVSFTFVAGTPDRAKVSNADAPWMQDGYWVEIFLGDSSNGTRVGALGVLDGKFLQTVVSEGGQVVWFELDYHKIDTSLFPETRFHRLPVYPGSWQDFSLLWNIDSGYAALDETLAKFTHPLLSGRDFLYFYKGKGLEKNQGSYTWRLWLSAPDRTLTGEDIDDFRTKWLAFLEKEGIAIRG